MKKFMSSAMSRSLIVSLTCSIFLIFILQTVGTGGGIEADKDPLADFTESLPKAQASNLEPKYAAGELIVKFKTPAEDATQEERQGHIDSIMASDSIEGLRARYGVTEVEGVFSDSGFGKLSGSETITEALDEKFAGFEDSFKGRRTRIAKDVKAPDLSTVYTFKLREGVDVLEAAQDFSRHPDVEYAEPNYVFDINAVPNDIDFVKQWSLNNSGQTGGIVDADIDAPESWDIEKGNVAIVIAVIDTGVDYNHPDLTGKVLPGYDYCNNDSDPIDDHGHGTHCAGVAAAITDNGIGIAGIAQGCYIMPLKFLNKYGSGLTSDGAKAIEYAVQNGADVISMSWGGYGYSQFLQDVINYADSQGCILVAAAGNDNSYLPIYPASHDHVISVSATDSTDNKASFTNYGRYIDIAAPGVYIYSSILNDSYTYWSGTSMACPHVAGVAALILSRNPDLTAEGAQEILLESADDLGDPGRDDIFGWGRVNAYQALLRTPTRDLSAKISIPETEDYIYKSGAIIGTAYGDGFKEYILDYGTGPDPSEWQLIGNSALPVDEDSLLADWDTADIAAGFYTVRLRAIGLAGETAEDRVVVEIVKAPPIVIEEFSINGLKQGDIWDNDEFECVVSIKNLWRGDFINITAELFTLDPRINITLGQAGFGNLGHMQSASNEESPLIFDTNGDFTKGEAITFVLKIYTDKGEVERDIGIKAGTRLQKGWPKTIPDAYDIRYSPTIADIDKDGSNEILLIHTVATGSLLWVFGEDGTPLSGYPAHIPEYSCNSGLTVADINNDGENEIVTTGLKGLYLQSQVIVLSPQGRVIGLSEGLGVRGEIIADIDQDAYGQKEIIAVGYVVSDAGAQASLINFSFDEDSLIEKNVAVNWKYDFPAPVYTNFYSPPAVGDVDGDGSLEVAVSMYNGGIYIFRNNGTVLWDYDIGGMPELRNGLALYTHPVCADVDLDGRDEVIAQLYDGPSHEAYRFGVLEYDEAQATMVLMDGWPKFKDEFYDSNKPLDFMVANIDDDPELEIICLTYHYDEIDITKLVHELHIYDYTGEMINASFPLEIPQYKGYKQLGPIADFNGDGKADITYFSRDEEDTKDLIYALDMQAQYIGLDTEFPMHVPGNIQGDGASHYRNIPAVSDIDIDGDIELISVNLYPGADEENSVYVWDLSAFYDSTAVEWGQFCHDKAHTGRYTGANQLPRILPIDDAVVKEGDILEFSIVAQDADDDDLTLEVTALPVTAEFSIISSQPGRIEGAFKWTPDYEQAGTYHLLFQVSDGKGAVVDKVVKIEVEENQPIILTSIEPAQGGWNGGQEIRISGNYFVPTMRVFLGEIELTGVEIVSETEARAVTPPASTPGKWDLKIVALNGSEGLLAGAYRYINYGDLTNDGSVTFVDAELLFKGIAGYASPYFPEDSPSDAGVVERSDVTGNGVLTALDVSYIMQYDQASIPRFPVETGYPVIEERNAQGTLGAAQDVQPGKEVDLTFTLNQVTGAQGINFTINYDTSKLELIQLTNAMAGAGSMFTSRTEAPGVVRVVAARPNRLSGSGIDIVNLKFRVKDKVEGATEVRVDDLLLNESARPAVVCPLNILRDFVEFDFRGWSKTEGGIWLGTRERMPIGVISTTGEKIRYVLFFASGRFAAWKYSWSGGVELSTSWNTANFQNGQYELTAQVYTMNWKRIDIGPVQIELKKPVPVSPIKIVNPQENSTVTGIVPIQFEFEPGRDTGVVIVTGFPGLRWWERYKYVQDGVAIDKWWFRGGDIQWDTSRTRPPQVAIRAMFFNFDVRRWFRAEPVDVTIVR